MVTVNGVAISDVDLQTRLHSGHAPGAAPSTAVVTPTVIDTVVREELVRQRAIELGLDRDPSYQRKRQQLSAELAAFERRELGDLFFQREIDQSARVSDDDARKYFSQNARMIQSELHLLQILYRRDENVARAALDEIKGGRPFEEVAKPHFPAQATEKAAPWDIGFLRWHQMPDAWLSVVFDLKPGEVSDVIKGPEGRFWILKLVERRENPNLTFEEVKPRILSVLERTTREERRARLVRELRDKAKVTYADPSLAPTPNAGDP
jgi:parvulin-like peptidyl-prolyl isomerase